MKIVIWLDDLRDPKSLRWRELIEMYAPEAKTALWVKTYDDFCEVFDRVTDDPNLTLDAVFFDNDLGEDKDGRHAFTWMEGRVRTEDIPTFTLYAQTANPAARVELQGGFKSLQRFWETS